jgi:hypothetical protein
MLSPSARNRPLPDPLAGLTSVLSDASASRASSTPGGGMATVYLAEDLKHHGRVALKLLRPEPAATMAPTASRARSESPPGWSIPASSV